ENLAARDRLYDLYLGRKELDKAKALTAEYAKAKPNDPGIHYFKGRDLELEGNFEGALKEFLESIKLLANFAPAFRRAGQAELRLGQQREGIEHLNQAVGIDPSDVSARLALARILMAQRDL